MMEGFSASQEVTVAQMLDARDRRAARKRELLSMYADPVISASLNIAGPRKNNAVLRRAFRAMLNALVDALRENEIEIEKQETLDAVTGCEALLVVHAEAEQLKCLCISVENTHPLGRLFDLDVTDRLLGEMSRETLGFSPRGCLVCGKVGRNCASRRLHTVEQLQEATSALLVEYFRKEDTDFFASQAVRALLYESCTTPKPGLVGRAVLGGGAESAGD